MENIPINKAIITVESKKFSIFLSLSILLKPFILHNLFTYFSKFFLKKRFLFTNFLIFLVKIFSLFIVSFTLNLLNLFFLKLTIKSKDINITIKNTRIIYLILIISPTFY